MGKLPDKIDSKFRYVLLSATRAEQLINGAPAKVELAGEKPSRVGMEEILQDKVDWAYGPPQEPEASEEEAVAAEGAK